MAKETGLGWPGVRERLADMSRRVLAALEAVQTQVNEFDVAMAERLVSIISERSKHLLKQLAD